MPKPSEITPRRRHLDRTRDAAVRSAYRVGWRIAARVPGPMVTAGIAVASRGALLFEGVHLRTLRHNLSIAGGVPADDALLRAGIASYLRTFWEVLALPAWTAAETVRRVRTEGEEHLRDAFAGPGAVVALPHSGNWDLAGAWACRTGMPVTTVAERLSDAEFAAFVAFRERLGMEVISHRESGAISTLAGAVRRRRLVCLMADRDLDGTGLPVRWHGHRLTMPAGPAMVARRTGAALVPAVCAYEPDAVLIRFGPPIPHRPGRDGLVAMTQEVADFFADRIAERPQDWHMLQPFFPGDAGGRGR